MWACPPGAAAEHWNQVTRTSACRPVAINVPESQPLGPGLAGGQRSGRAALGGPGGEHLGRGALQCRPSQAEGTARANMCGQRLVEGRRGDRRQDRPGGSSSCSGPHGTHGGVWAFTVRTPSVLGDQGGAVRLLTAFWGRCPARCGSHRNKLDLGLVLRQKCRKTTR